MEQNLIRRFMQWMALKLSLKRMTDYPEFTKNEVWWTAIGDNIGIEINGKSEKFSRPVLIFKKFSPAGFLGVPLTTQEHTGTWYAEIEFQDKKIYAALSQIRVFSAARLYERIGQISNGDRRIVKNKLKHLYFDE